MTTRETILELVAAWHANDALRAGGFFAPEGRYQESGREAVCGRAAVVAHFTRFFRDGPPWRFEIDELVVEGERAALTYRFAVKGDGEGWDERAGCAMVRLREGLVAEWREWRLV
ncbi:MAG TPA: nuclear transport factor 2 family protein [Verrucomicrobiae bacterium]|nr:nuclear transport factor 2 family protein [Verrucomicrobiae bacterium]